MVTCAVLQARMVAAATTTLCDAANAAVQGNASEERLIAGAKQVSNSTAQLLLACRVKADSNSEAQRRLQVCTVTWLRLIAPRIFKVIDKSVRSISRGTLFTTLKDGV